MPKISADKLREMQTRLFSSRLVQIAEYDDRDEDVEKWYEEAARYEAECEQEESNEDR